MSIHDEIVLPEHWLPITLAGLGEQWRPSVALYAEAYARKAIDEALAARDVPALNGDAAEIRAAMRSKLPNVEPTDRELSAFALGAEYARDAAAEPVISQRAHYMFGGDEAANLRDILQSNGFVPCDIAACNCGSWHHRYGLPERCQEIKDALSEAGHPLSNANGHLVGRALADLVAERDALRAALVEAKQVIRGWHGEDVWDIYDQHSPEMKRINAAIDAAPAN